MYREGRRVPGIMAVFVCFAVLMAPETEIIIAGQSYGAQVKCVVLLVLFGLGLRYLFVSKYDQAPAEKKTAVLALATQ